MKTTHTQQINPADNICIAVGNTIITPEFEAVQAARKQDINRRAAVGTPLLAQIKRTSKYFGQTSVVDGRAGRPGIDAECFPVVVVVDDGGPCDYVPAGGPGGRYRLQDVDLFAVVVGGKHIKLN